MIRNKTVIKTTLAMLLAFSIVFPTVVKYFHHHKTEISHNNCSNENTHFHKGATDLCDICFFKFSSFSHSTLKHTILIPSILHFEPIQEKYALTYKILAFSNTQLRAPPFFLS